MQIIGFNFTKISAEKEGNVQGKVNISMNINFPKLEKETTKALEHEVLKADFDFNVNYEKIAKFNFRGSVFVTATPEKIKEMLKKWEKDKKLPEEIKVPLFNFVLTKCNLKALQFEEEFSLPTHIPLPKVSQAQPEEKNKKAGYTG